MVGMVIWSVLLALVAGVWASRHLAINRARREFPPLTADTFPDPVPDPPRVSVLIAAKDEEANIEDCLRSVAWADEAVVVDACSEDSTVEIARRYADKVFVRPWPGYGHLVKNDELMHLMHKHIDLLYHQ